MATYASFIKEAGIDNSTIGIDANKKLYIKTGGITTTQIATDAVTTAQYLPYKSGSVNVASGKTVAANRAIPVTHGLVLKTTGDEAEALTLADGVPGQVLTITLAVDGGGSGTLTPATKTGFSTIVFADAGDTATLEFVDATTGWVLRSVYGLTEQPVVTA